jgi:hypothetical protein
MNTERIRELAKQAGDDWDHTLEEDKEFLKKFAELLLNEFIDALEYSNCRRSETSDYGLSILINDIKNHFGVKE